MEDRGGRLASLRGEDRRDAGRAPAAGHAGHPRPALRGSRGGDPCGGGPEVFDEVVLATHSDQALAMLADPSDAEGDVLGAIAYQSNEAVLHTDRSLLPQRRRAWASWNYHLLDEPVDRTTVTYYMNRLQSLRSDTSLCVTLNQTERIDPEKVVTKVQYAHPVYTREALAAQARWHEMSGPNRTHYCGAWWGYGFHEDGVESALRVGA